MAFYVGITKIKECESSGFYRVIHEDTQDFFININFAKRTIEFFKDEISANSGSIDLNKPDQIIEIAWLPPKVVYAVFVKSKEAIHAKKFPDSLSFCS